MDESLRLLHRRVLAGDDSAIERYIAKLRKVEEPPKLWGVLYRKAFIEDTSHVCIESVGMWAEMCPLIDSNEAADWRQAILDREEAHSSERWSDGPNRLTGKDLEEESPIHGIAIVDEALLNILTPEHQISLEDEEIYIRDCWLVACCYEHAIKRIEFDVPILPRPFGWGNNP
jgi:hypothetical protein